MDKSPDLRDWEVLHNNSDGSDSAAEELGEVTSLSIPQQLVDASCDAVFQSDYFSLDSGQKPPSSDDGSALSDNPTSWIDPASDVSFQLPPRNSADFWSDSGSDRSVSRRLNQMIDGDEKTNLVKYWSDSGEAFNLEYKEESQGESKLGFDFCPTEHEKDCNSDANVDESTHDEVDNEGGGSPSIRSLVTEEMKPVEKEEEEEEKSARGVVWWKFPLDLLRCCVFRVSPVWSLSVAAAVVGFVILGRRLYKMKRKTHALHLNLIIDDKRVSQFRSHAARLNEAFSLVRRVPILRPSLPPPGAAPWPVMTMR